ncbi:MAG: hypothetical protein HRF50_07500 [Phycisphaerae bacterium]
MRKRRSQRASAAAAAALLSMTLAAMPAGAECLTSKLLSGDPAATDNFGVAVAIDGDYLAAGAHHDDEGAINAGAVYVFQRSGGAWLQRAKLRAADPTANDVLGLTVAIDGDTVVAGAFLDNSPTFHAGSAYVFRGSGANWLQEVKLVAPVQNIWQEFGASVDISGDRVAVGAPLGGDPNAPVGQAFVFLRAGTSWGLEAELTRAADDADPNEAFGSAVAIDGDVACVGADMDSDAQHNRGAAYVFRRSGDAWTREAKLTASDGGAEHRFGNAVDIQGDLALIGAYSYDAPGPVYNAGAAYVFRRVHGAWSQEARLTAPTLVTDASFGISVALDGDRALIGSWWDDEAVDTAGAAYVYRYNAGAWVLEQTLLANDPAAMDNFGVGVALDGASAVVGAWQDDEAALDAGAAYTFELDADCNGNGICDGQELTGDLNGDARVDLADLSDLLSPYGACTGDPAYNAAADLDGSGCVSLADLSLLLENFGLSVCGG